ncbi:hypothetical protein [Trichothermofontia sp.]
MHQPLNKIREDLSQLVAMSADLVRVSQQQTRNLEIQTQQIGMLSEAITESRLLSEAQGQRMEQGFAEMRQGFDRLEHAIEAQGQRMERNLDRLAEVTQSQGQQMLSVVQQLAQVVDRLAPKRDSPEETLRDR